VDASLTCLDLNKTLISRNQFSIVRIRGHHEIFEPHVDHPPLPHRGRYILVHVGLLNHSRLTSTNNSREFLNQIDGDSRMDLMRIKRKIRRLWSRFWLLWVYLGPLGFIGAHLAAWPWPPLYDRAQLRMLSRRGYTATSSSIYHNQLWKGDHVFIGDHVLIYQDRGGGPVDIADEVRVFNHTTIQTGLEGSVTIGANTRIQPRCQLSAYKASIRIGSNVGIAPNCALYSYDHGTFLDNPISSQPLQTKGDIIIEDGAWLGVGVIVLSGVRIGRGAVVGAGSLVTRDIPDNSIAYGVPAKVAKTRVWNKSEPLLK